MIRYLKLCVSKLFGLIFLYECEWTIIMKKKRHFGKLTDVYCKETKTVNTKKQLLRFAFSKLSKTAFTCIPNGNKLTEI